MENLFCNVADVHICGACQSQFSLIASFVAHIKVCAKRQSPSPKENIPNLVITHPAPSQTPVLHIPDDEEDEEEEEDEQTFGDDCRPDVQVIVQETPIPQTIITNDTSAFLLSDVNGVESCQTPVIDNNTATTFPPQNSVQVTTPTILSNSTPKDVVKYKKVTVMGTTKFRCTYELCAFTTQYLKDLDRHYRIHTGEKPYHCWQCGKRFSRKDKLKIHQMAHKGEKPFKCQECNYATNDNSSLVKHRRVHTGERPYKCQICPYASRNASQLVVHLRTHTGDTPFHCRLCHMKFKINSDLKRHSRLHTGEKPYLCTFCGYRCSIKGNLNAHMKSHVTESPLQCELCDFVTPSRKDLRAHERLHQARAYQCQHCSYTASSQSALNIHLRIHSHEKPYKCLYCPFTSRQSCNVRTHIRKKHPDKLPATPKVRKKGLMKGKVVVGQHKSTKPACRKTFKCKVCKSGFVRIDSLRCHLRQHQAEQLLAEAQANANSDIRPSDNPPLLIQSGTDPQPREEIIPNTSTSEPVTLTFVPSTTASQPTTYLTNTLQTQSSESTFNNINFTDPAQLGNASGLNIVLTSPSTVAVPSPSVQADYLINKENYLKGMVNKTGKEDYNELACTKDGLTQAPVNTQTINTYITTTPMQNTNELGFYQFYQMPANVSFVTVPVVPSASTSQNSYTGNILNGIGELDTTSLVNPSTSTLLLGHNVQYVISQAPSKLNSNTCT